MTSEIVHKHVARLLHKPLGVFVVSCPQRLKVSPFIRVLSFWSENLKWHDLTVFFSSEMRYVAAYLLATLGGKSNPSKEDVQRILESVGLDVDDEKLSKV